MRFAEVAGATYVRARHGLEIVEFEAPAWEGEPVVPVTETWLARTAADAAPEPEAEVATPGTASPAPGAPSAQATASAPASAPAAPTGRGGADIEDIYDQVVERLRRELLVERERMGDLLGDLP